MRIGIVIVAASLFVLARELIGKRSAGAFISAPFARQIAVFFAPLLAFIAIIPWLGLYLGAAIYLAFAVGYVGRVPWLKTLLIAVATPAAMFFLFEVLFLSPLPKGPLALLFGML
jgi:hypothetical protein